MSTHENNVIYAEIKADYNVLWDKSKMSSESTSLVGTEWFIPKENFSRNRLKGAHEQIDKGALTTAVGTYQTVEFSREKIKGDIIENITASIGKCAFLNMKKSTVFHISSRSQLFFTKNIAEERAANE